VKDFVIKTVFIVSLILMMSDGKYFPWLNIIGSAGMFGLIIGSKEVRGE